MAAGARELREERRVVTVLAADLVGSTALGGQLDPEEARLVVGEAVARMVRAVEELGGTVKDLAGDGIFALFGAPTAHEDDPERAVRAGLRIADEIAAYASDVERGWGIGGFAVRVGVTTGLVVLEQPLCASALVEAELAAFAVTGKPEHGQGTAGVRLVPRTQPARAPEPVVLEIHDAAVADRLADYVDETRGRYPPATPPDQRG